MMAGELTREQVETIKDECLDDHWWGVFRNKQELKHEAVKVITQLIDSDARLRQRVEALEQELDRSKKNEVGLNGMLHLSKKALGKPCINCGYEQKVVRS